MIRKNKAYLRFLERWDEAIVDYYQRQPPSSWPYCFVVQEQVFPNKDEWEDWDFPFFTLKEAQRTIARLKEDREPRMHRVLIDLAETYIPNFISPDFAEALLEKTEPEAQADDLPKSGFKSAVYIRPKGCYPDENGKGPRRI